MRPGPRPKVILSTNVAESSVTIAGRRRRRRRRARAGREPLALDGAADPAAGEDQPGLGGAARRVAPGARGRDVPAPLHAARLTTRVRRHDVPEVRRADLAEAVLLLHAARRRGRRRAFGWFERRPSRRRSRPPRAARSSRRARRDGAVDERWTTDAALPLHPRLGAAPRRGRGARRRRRRRHRLRAPRRAARRRSAGARAATPTSPSASRSRAATRWSSARGSSSRAWSGAGRRRKDPDAALGMAVLAAFPDRVGKRRRRGEAEIVFAAGGTAELARESVVRDAELLVAVDAEERRTGTHRRTLVRVASAVRARVAARPLPDALREEREVVWNESAGRVEMRGAPLLRRARPRRDAAARRPPATPRPPPRSSRASPSRRGPDRFAPGARTLPRAPPLRRHGVPRGGHRRARARRRARVAVRPARKPRRPRARRPRRSLARHARRREQAPAPRRDGARARHAPRRPRVPVEYGDPPSIASRLQDFFGMTRTPAVAGGRVPLVLHLLAPNGRDVQVTSDLAGLLAEALPVHPEGARAQISEAPLARGPAHRGITARDVVPPRLGPPRARRLRLAWRAADLRGQRARHHGARRFVAARVHRRGRDRPRGADEPRRSDRRWLRRARPRRRRRDDSLDAEPGLFQRQLQCARRLAGWLHGDERDARRSRTRPRPRRAGAAERPRPHLASPVGRALRGARRRRGAARLVRSVPEPGRRGLPRLRRALQRARPARPARLLVARGGRPRQRRRAARRRRTTRTPTARR